jgi:DNA end-binding protein Ku
MAERAIWNGGINFGLVNIPVKLYSATENKGISFHQIHNKCKTRIQEKRWCSKCNRAVEWDEIEKGFEYAKGKYVAVTKEDLESLPLPTKDTIVIQAFVKLSEIDPIYFDKNYYLKSEEKAARPFNLLMNALSEKQMVAIGSFAMRSKERLCCLRAAGGTLLLDTLFYPDEIKVQLNTKVPKIKTSKQELDMVSKLIDMMAQKFDVNMYQDNYREALEKVIEAKLEGVTVKQPKATQKGKVLDLMEALQRSLKGTEMSKQKTKKQTTKAPKKVEKISSRRSVRKRAG